MLRDWSSLRITVLLYLLVFLFPINLYFANKLIDDTQNDATTVKNIGLIGGGIQQLTIYAPEKIDKQLMSSLDLLLSHVDSEFMQRSSNQFDIGFHNPQIEFSSLKVCWRNFKTSLPKQTERKAILKSGEKCWKQSTKLSIVVEKMANVKREQALNGLYLSLVFTMIITVLMIYFIRAYMRRQLEKHTIYDLATKLFNRDYFYAEIAPACSLAERHEYDLSIMFIAIDDFDDMLKMFGTEKNDKVLERFGGLLLSLTRTSDTTCRYDDDTFAIITPQTDLQNVLMVAERIRMKVLAHDFMIQHPMTVSLSVAKYQPGEEVNGFVQRAEKTLDEARKVRNKVLTAEVMRS